jgi:putative phage-type endonuclease
MYIYPLTTQQGNEEWHHIRSTLITASDVAAICRHNKYVTPDEILRKKISQFRNGVRSTYTSSAMMTGIREEPFAIREYERVMGIICKQYGLLRHEYYPWIAGSPDFITTGLCPILGEVKTLISRKHVAGELPEMYHFQILTLLEILQIPLAHAVQFIPNRTLDILPIARDPTWFAKYLPELHAFHVRLSIYLHEGDHAGMRHDVIQTTIIPSVMPILRIRNTPRKMRQDTTVSTTPRLSKRVRIALLPT